MHLFNHILKSLHFKPMSLAQLLPLDFKLHLCSLLLCNQLLEGVAGMFMFFLHLLSRLTQ